MSKIYPNGARALVDVNLKIGKGDLVFMVGPSELSGGEQQRVCVARAIINNPALLVADEPTGNLDPETAWGIMDLLYNINKRGTTIVMATHARAIVNKMQKRVIAIENGRIARDEEKGGYGYDA